MGVIRKLTQEEIAKVAAGEVIENPASVVKELIENAIDASATNIKIYVEKGGCELIEVIDDGCGMSKEDLISCVQSHTTSKLKNITEIEHVHTLGFRGEALYSIASVSELTIESKLEKELAGYMIRTQNNEIVEKKTLGVPTGTRICVKDLFYNLPARKTHINNSKNEFQKIVQEVVNLAIQYCEIDFKLYHNRELIHQFFKTQDKYLRIEQVLGQKLTYYLLSFEKMFSDHHIKVSGYVSKPQGVTSKLGHQYIYVNGRHIKSNRIKKAIKDTFNTLIDVKYNPNFVLYLDVPFEYVDVNIHPKKESVLLFKEELVLDCISKTIKEILETNNLTYAYNSEESYSKKANKNLLSVLKESSDVWNVKTSKDKKDIEILQVNKLYLITETKNGIIIYDQHAVHERILYEEYLKVYKNSKHKFISIDQEIEIPVTLQNILDKSIKKIKDSGIEILNLKGNKYKIIKVDAVFRDIDLVLLLHDVLSDIESNKNNINDFSLKTLSYMACRSAIKGGEYLTYEERKNLLEKLKQTKTNYTCPHGRPVCIEISGFELKKMFRR